MSTAVSVKTAIMACITTANNATGQSANNVTDAIVNLIEKLEDAAPSSGGSIKTGSVMVTEAYSPPYIVPLEAPPIFFALFRAEDIMSGYTDETIAVVYTGTLASYDLEVYGAYGPKTSLGQNKNTVATVQGNNINISPYNDLAPGIEYKYIAVYADAIAPELPTLTNPASAANIDSGMQAIGSDGEIIYGTSTAAAQNTAAKGAAEEALGQTFADVEAAMSAALSQGGGQPTSYLVGEVTIVSALSTWTSVMSAITAELGAVPDGHIWYLITNNNMYNLSTGYEFGFGIMSNVITNSSARFSRGAYNSSVNLFNTTDACSVPSGTTISVYDITSIT